MPNPNKVKAVIDRYKKGRPVNTYLKFYIDKPPWEATGNKPIGQDNFIDGDKLCTDYKLDAASTFEDLKNTIDDKAILNIPSNIAFSSIPISSKTGFNSSFIAVFILVVFTNCPARNPA